MTTRVRRTADAARGRHWVVPMRITILMLATAIAAGFGGKVQAAPAGTPPGAAQTVAPVATHR